ncbi:SDR family NAD(P)-dependent oxidoreductase [Pseudodesulfovibrio methanolicus]|uniref:Glucose 1-dehydrogenase n=1 Tax=Pseudodesulfovibrio methanolicus TaxID=3126690 RepID=A0ABZ2IYI1_9BACT
MSSYKNGHSPDADGFFNLDENVSIITGAAGDLGADIAMTLASRGSSLLLSDLNAEGLEEKADAIRRATGQRVECAVTDVCKVADLKAMAAAAMDAFGRIDVLVNSAGINIPQEAMDVTEAAWDKVLDINLKGSFFACQAVAEHMIAQRSGKIINISSQAGAVGLIRRAAYCSSKGAINNLTRELALEWAQYNINVNAVAPTFVETNLTRPMFEEKEFRDYVRANILFDRLAVPADISAGVLYLASPASDMVTGHILHIDGGWTVH